MISSEQLKDMWTGQKVIVLLEHEPLSDHFAQVMLTQQEFKEMTAGLFKALPQSGTPGCKIISTRETLFHDIYLPNIPTLYTEAQKNDPEL